MKRAFLIVLVIVCLAVAAWTAYLLFTNQTDPIVGWVIFAVDIGVLFWNISVLRAYRIRAGSVVAVFLVNNIGSVYYLLEHLHFITTFILPFIYLRVQTL